MARNTDDKSLPPVAPVHKYVTMLTHKEYEHGLSIYDDGTAHIIKTKTGVQLQKIGDEFYFNGIPESHIDWSNLMDSEQRMDRQPLRILYTCVDQMLERDIAVGKIDPYAQYVPCEFSVDIRDFLRRMGLDPNQVNQKRIQNLMRTISSYENVIGVIPSRIGHKNGYIFSRLMVWTRLDDVTHRLWFSCPYLVDLKMASYRKSLEYTDSANPRLRTNKDGSPKRLPNRTNLMKPSLKDGYASEIVEVVLVLLERTSGLAKDTTPQIMARTIVDQCPMLSEALEKATPQNRNVILDRAWRKAWTDIREHTFVAEAFINLKLPDPNAKSARPTYGKLSKTKFVFPHDGKKKNWMYATGCDVIEAETSDVNSDVQKP